MENNEEPELFDMEVVCENPQDEQNTSEFSDTILTTRPPELKKRNVKRIIYIEEDSSDSSLDSDSDANAQPHQKHTTQKITIENIVERKQVSLKRKLDLNTSGDLSTVQKVKYSNITGSTALNFSQLDELLNNATISTNTRKQISSSPCPVVEIPASVCLSQIKTNESDSKPDKRVPTKVDQALPKIQVDSGLSSYYPSALKLGLVHFSAVRGVQEAANLFRIPKELMISWTNHEDKIIDQFKKDFFAEWEKNLFLDVITCLSNKEPILLQDVINKRKSFQPNSANSDSASMIKWAIDWCRQFRLQLDYNQDAPEVSSLSLPGIPKTADFESSVQDKRQTFIPALKVKDVPFVSRTKAPEKSLVQGPGNSENLSPSKTFSPRFKLQALQYADRFSLKEAGQRYHLKLSTIRRWLCEKSVIEKQVKKSALQKAEEFQRRYKTLEDELCEWYREMNSKGKATRHSLVISKARSLARKLNIDDFEPTPQWYSRWWKICISTSKDCSTKSKPDDNGPDSALLLKDEWNKLLQDSNAVPSENLERSSNIPVLIRNNLESEITKKPDITGALDSGLEDSSDVSSEKEHVSLHKIKQRTQQLLSSQPEVNPKENSTNNRTFVDEQHVEETQKTNQKLHDTTSLQTETAVPLQHDSELLNTKVTKRRSSIANLDVSNIKVNIDSAMGDVKKSVNEILLGNMSVQVLVEKINSNAMLRYDDSGNPCSISSSQLDSKTALGILPSEELVKNANNCDNSSESYVLGLEDNSIPFARSTSVHSTESDKIKSSVANFNRATKLDGLHSSTSSSQNPSLYDTSPESSVYSSGESNSSLSSENLAKQQSLKGSFQQIFLKFAQDGNQPINDQKSIMGLASDSEHSRTESFENLAPSSSKEGVQSSYVLRNKPQNLTSSENQARKESIIKSLRLTPIKPITADMYSKKSRTISRRLGYSFAAGPFRQKNCTAPDKQSRKTGKNRKRSKKHIYTLKRSKERKSSVKEPQSLDPASQQMEIDDFEAPAYPACFQHRVIEIAEMKGVEEASSEFGLQSSLVTDWIHSKNSIKMLSNVENFQEWELDLYVLVHKVNLKGQKLSLVDLVCKGAEVLSALSLSDCFTFNNESALDWCERFGVGLCDEASTKTSQKETTGNQTNYQENFSDDYIAEVCDYTMKNSSLKAHKKFGVPVSKIRTWIVKHIARQKQIVSRGKAAGKRTVCERDLLKPERKAGEDEKNTETREAENANSESPNHHRQKHTNKFMAEVCSFTTKNSLLNAHRKYGIPKSTIRSWILKTPNKFNDKPQNATSKQPARHRDVLKKEDLEAKKNSEPSPDSKESSKTDRHENVSGGRSVSTLTNNISNSRAIVRNFKSKNVGNKTFGNHNQGYLKYRKKYVNSPSHLREKYTDEFRKKVVDYAHVNGVSAASTEFQLNTSVVYHWAGRKSTGRLKFSEEVKAQAMKYAEKHSLAATSAKYCISLSLLNSWRFQRKLQSMTKSGGETIPSAKVPKAASEIKSSTPTNAKPVVSGDNNVLVSKTKKAVAGKQQKVSEEENSAHSPKFKQMVIEYAKNHSVQWASKKHKVEYKLVKSWVLESQAEFNAGKVPSNTKHSKAFIEKVVNYANNHSVQYASKKFDVKYKLLKSWVLQSQPASNSEKLNDNSHDKAFIEKVVAYALDKSCKSASEHFVIPKSNIYDWVRKRTPHKDQPEKAAPQYKDLEPIEKELLTWCQIVQANESSIRASKVISKAKVICHQMSIEDSMVGHEWYKYWSTKYQDVLSQSPEADSPPALLPSKRTRKITAGKSKPADNTSSDQPDPNTLKECSDEASVVNNDSAAELSTKSSTVPKSTNLDLATTVSPVEEIVAESASPSQKLHTHFTRKVNRKFCKFCNSDHHHGNEDQKHADDNSNDSKPENLKQDVADTNFVESDSIAEPDLNLTSPAEEVPENPVSRSSRTSTPSSGRRDLGIVPRDQITRACKNITSSVSKDENTEVTTTFKDDKGSDTVIVISDPGWVFDNWLKEINSTQKQLSWTDVKEKMEYIVQRTHEDHFDHWLFRLYSDVVKNVNHPLFNTQNVSTVLGLNGYVSAEVKLDILQYAERRSVEEAASCFNIPLEKITEWKESKPHIQHVLRVKDLFVTNPKNLHIDLDIYEWYLKVLSRRGEVDETELRLRAEETFLEHGGVSIKRWYKWFVDRFQKVCAIDSVQSSVLKTILESLDCNVNLTKEKVILLFEERMKPHELKSLFPTSELWFKQFYEKYSDYLTQDFQVVQALPGDLRKQCDTHKTTVQDMRCDLELSSVGSMDEFPIWFSFRPDPTSNDDPKLLDKSFSDADGVVLFACLANGTMLSPFITFKNSCKKNVAPASENIVTDPVLSQWLQKVWLTEVTTPKSLVILDSFSPHLSAKFKQTAQQCNVQLAFVPPGCNSAVHPVCSGLSVHFQKLLNELRVKRHSEELIGRSEIVSLVNDVYCMIFKEEELVRKAFSVTGVISVK